MAKRGNDAIPTWSGFNYQGKIMILCVLEIMKALILNDQELTRYDVELEKHEDFVIFIDEIPNELYQVKATLSKSKYSQHLEALEKLIKHKNELGNSSAKCFFASAREIDDWNDALNIYASEIELLKHNGKVIDIKIVIDYIKSTIKEMLNVLDYSEDNVDNVYLALCELIDKKISEIHKQSKKDKKYKINFLDIKHTILDTICKNEDMYYSRSKEDTYNFVVNDIQDAMKSLCSDCNIELESCDNMCAAKEAFEQILMLNDIETYFKILRPEILDWSNDRTITSRINKDNVKDLILTLFYFLKNPQLVKSNECCVKMVSKHSKTENNIIIPTLLDISPSVLSGNRNIQNTFQSIKENSLVLSHISGCAISAKTINSCGKSIEEHDIMYQFATNKCENSINNIYKTIRILSYSDLVNKFKGGEKL